MKPMKAKPMGKSSLENAIVTQAAECMDGVEIGGHKIISHEHKGIETYLCADCSWERTLNKELFSEKEKIAEVYILGDALETSCDDDRDVEVELNYGTDGVTANVCFEPKRPLRDIEAVIEIDGT